MKLLLLGTILAAASGARLGGNPSATDGSEEFFEGVLNSNLAYGILGTPLPVIGDLHTSSRHLFPEPASSNTHSQGSFSGSHLRVGRNKYFSPYQQNGSEESEISRHITTHHGTASDFSVQLPHKQQDTHIQEDSMTQTAQHQEGSISFPVFSRSSQSDMKHLSQQQEEENKFSQKLRGDSRQTQHKNGSHFSQSWEARSQLPQLKHKDSRFSQRQHEAQETFSHGQQEKRTQVFTDKGNLFTNQRDSLGHHHLLDDVPNLTDMKTSDQSSTSLFQFRTNHDSLRAHRDQSRDHLAPHSGLDQNGKLPFSRDQEERFYENPFSFDALQESQHAGLQEKKLPQAAHPFSSGLVHTSHDFGPHHQQSRFQKEGLSAGQEGIRSERQHKPKSSVLDTSGSSEHGESPHKLLTRKMQEISGHIESAGGGGVFQPFLVPSSARLAEGRLTTSSSFSCLKHGQGFFADVESRCRMFHVCTPSRAAEGSSTTTQYRFTFRCGEEERFEQHSLTCSNSLSSSSCPSSSAFIPINHAAASTLFSHFLTSALPPSRDVCYLAQDHVITGVRR